jgi:hypothetical protein
MSEEWDEISNDPEDSAYGNISDQWATTSLGSTYSDVIRSEELVRISAETDYRCSRHGDTNSLTIQARGESSGPPRRVQACIHCFMDLLVERCGAQDSDHDRRTSYERDRMMMSMMRNTQVDDRMTRLDSPIRMETDE